MPPVPPTPGPAGSLRADPDARDVEPLRAATPSPGRRDVSRTRLACGIVLGLIVVAGAWLGWRAVVALPDLSRWDVPVEAAAREFDLDADLLRGLMAAESGGDPDAVSRAGAVGLLQLMPATAREEAARLHVADFDAARLTDGPLNVRLGASYLARQLRRFEGQVPFALAAYNAGPTRVRRWRDAAPGATPSEVIEREGFPETRRHLRRVLRLAAAYRRR